jgi:hypothetical protein
MISDRTASFVPDRFTRHVSNKNIGLMSALRQGDLAEKN